MDMTKSGLKWFFIQIKLCLQSLSFYMMTFMLTLGLYLTAQVINEYDKNITVLMWSSASELGDSCIESLTANSPDGFSFIKAESENELISNVAAGKYSCGIVWKEKNDKVTIYQTSGSYDGYVIQEILFPVMRKESALEEFNSYLFSIVQWDEDENAFIPDKTAISYTMEKYENYLNGMDVDIYELVNLDLNGDLSGDNDIINAPANENRGQVRWYIYCTLLAIELLIIWLDSLSADKGFYKSLRKGNRVKYRLINVMTTFMMSTLIAVVINNIIAGI